MKRTSRVRKIKLNLLCYISNFLGLRWLHFCGLHALTPSMCALLVTHSHHRNVVPWLPSTPQNMLGEHPSHLYPPGHLGRHEEQSVQSCVVWCDGPSPHCAHGPRPPLRQPTPSPSNTPFILFQTYRQDRHCPHSIRSSPGATRDAACPPSNCEDTPHLPWPYRTPA